MRPLWQLWRLVGCPEGRAPKRAGLACRAAKMKSSCAHIHPYRPMLQQWLSRWVGVEGIIEHVPLLRWCLEVVGSGGCGIVSGVASGLRRGAAWGRLGGESEGTSAAVGATFGAASAVQSFSPFRRGLVGFLDLSDLAGP